MAQTGSVRDYRLQRIWAIVDRINRGDGPTRSMLAEEFHCSFRQIGDDLRYIRRVLALPLERTGNGYRLCTCGLLGARHE